MAWYVNSVAYAAVTQWASSTAVSVGQIVRNLAAVTYGRERCFVCTVAGTTGATEPAWPYATNNGTVTDGTVTWKNITGQEAYQAPGAWSAPFANLAGVLNATTAYAYEPVYVSSNHHELIAGNITLGSATIGYTTGATITCVNETGTGHIPPQESDVTTGAIVEISSFVSGGGAMTFGGSNATGVRYQGISFRITAAYGGNPCNFSLPGVYTEFVDCDFVMNNASGIYSNFKVTAYGGYAYLDNVSFKFGNSDQRLMANNGFIKWVNSPSAINPSGSIPTALFYGDTTCTSRFVADGVDLSALGSNKVADGYPGIDVTLQSCKLGAFPVAMPGGALGGMSYEQSQIQVLNCDSGAGGLNHQLINFSQDGHVQLVSVTDVSATGGASDGTTAYSWLVEGTNPNGRFTPAWTNPFRSFPIAVWNTTTGAAINVTIEGVREGTALPTNKEVWLEVSYFGSATDTRYSRASGAMLNIAATPVALDASTAAWDNSSPSRANSTAYALHDVIKLASNPGRIFFCATAGTSAASEPAGYASAVDGGTVTDGTAVFTAGVRFKQTVAITPQAVGMLEATVQYAFAAASRMYINPKLVVA